jgi:hypothetical protein
MLKKMRSASQSSGGDDDSPFSDYTLSSSPGAGAIPRFSMAWGNHSGAIAEGDEGEDDIIKALLS